MNESNHTTVSNDELRGRVSRVCMDGSFVPEPETDPHHEKSTSSRLILKYISVSLSAKDVIYPSISFSAGASASASMSRPASMLRRAAASSNPAAHTTARLLVTRAASTAAPGGSSDGAYSAPTPTSSSSTGTSASSAAGQSAGPSTSGTARTTHFGFRDIPEEQKETLGEFDRHPRRL
jgi:hypothetical protein